MKTTADFLDALRVKLDVPSDYAVALKMGMHRQQVSHYRLMKGAFDDATCMRVAEILELDPAYVMACMHHQRAKQEEVKQVWEKLAKRLAVAAALVGVAIALPFAGVGQDVGQGGMVLALAGLTAPNALISNVHYVKCKLKS